MATSLTFVVKEITEKDHTLLLDHFPNATPVYPSTQVNSHTEGTASYTLTFRRNGNPSPIYDEAHISIPFTRENETVVQGLGILFSKMHIQAPQIPRVTRLKVDSYEE